VTFEAAGEPDRAALASWPGIAKFRANELLVARDDVVVAALAWRQVAPGQREILYIETAHGQRRRGVAKALLKFLLAASNQTTYLEVRESNEAAMGLYRQCGFEPVGRRLAYYSDPVETAIVLKFCSC
jgi:ribosomal-protein-alanine N-acetyltransferase